MAVTASQLTKLKSILMLTLVTSHQVCTFRTRMEWARHFSIRKVSTKNAVYFDVPVQGLDSRTLPDLSCQHGIKEEKSNTCKPTNPHE